MAGPWEKYSGPAQSGPWAKYAQPEQPQGQGFGNSVAQPDQAPGRTAIATTPDGGTIWELSGGQRVFSSPNYSTSDPDRVAKLMKGATPADVSKSGWNQTIIDQNPLAARAVKAVEGTPFVGTYADEAVGAVYGDQARDAWRATSHAMDDERPWQSAGLGAAGGLATGVPLAMAAGPGLAAKSLGGNMARGAGLGFVEGAVSGFGGGEDGAYNRGNSALVRGAIGAGVGAAVPAIAHGVGALAGEFRNRLNAARGIDRVAKELGVSKDAGRLVSDTLALDDPAAMRMAIQRAGPDAMLADAGPSAQNALDNVMQSPGEGARVAMRRIDDRAGGAYYDVMDALTGNQQGPRIPPATLQNRMSESARGVVNPAYQRAYSTPIDYASPEGQAIEELISRVPPSKANAAIKSATDRMIYDQAPSPQIMASIADNGSVSLSQMPNVMQLDYMKRAFDEVAEDSKDAITGRMTSDGAFASRIARDIRETTKAAVPAYGEALEVAANDIRQRGAVRTGQSLLSPKTTVEDAMQEIAGATGAERRAMRDGLLGQVEHVLGNVRAVASDQNIAPRQAIQALRDLSSPNAQRKMEALFGNDWPGVKDAIDRASAAIGLRASVAANSRTFGRQQFGQMLDESLEPGPIRKGQPVLTARSLWQRGMKAAPDQIRNAKASSKSEVADLLTRQGAAATLDAIERARSAFPLSADAGAGVVDGLLATGVGAAPALSELLRKRLLRQ